MYLVALIICCKLQSKSYREVRKLSTLLHRKLVNTCYVLYPLKFPTLPNCCSVLENLNLLTDNYPLPDKPPLLLLYETFAVVLFFNIDSSTFSGSTVAFDISNSSTSGFNEDNIVTDATSTDTMMSVHLSDSLGKVLEGHRDSKIVFTVYANEGLFLERMEYKIESNLTSQTLGSVVVSARVTGGVKVSDIEEVVTLTFIKNDMVRSR